MRLNGKVRAYIGFAVKSGKIKYGIDNIAAAKKIPDLIMLYSGAAQRTVNNTNLYAQKVSCPIILLDEPPLEGRDCKVLGVYEPELAKAILTNI